MRLLFIFFSSFSFPNLTQSAVAERASYVGQDSDGGREQVSISPTF
jgi:hypothetical protein